MEKSSWGSFALVSYVPEPLQSFIEALRPSVLGNWFPQPHLTLLPPRALRVPLNQASDQARQVLLRFDPFPVELSSVQIFPETNVLYLSAANADEKIFEIHRALNLGDLAAVERFEFRPHLTIGGPIPLENLVAVRSKAESAWSAFSEAKQFIVDEVVALWASPDQEQIEWKRLWTYSLSSSLWKTASAST